MSDEELVCIFKSEYVSPNTKKFLESLTCADARDLRIFNMEKATKGEKKALENLKSRNPQVYEKHTTYMRTVFKTLGEEDTQFFVKAESLGEEAAQGESTIIEALNDEYKSLSAETRAKLETEFPIFRKEDALDIIYVRPFLGQE
ncbi:hypothetical protein PRIPAC_93205 [Pristionchus pacificus]|uniref:Uncharacterized protein n=1 Tax=Pristionchus pacificus TaxID=54126 RepID=A0A2A6CE01_PRIPA|nr:hypothetical protein PRIPAC_93205 [Pristionchus pacificus]|eukprot:PDM76231.1 hypothetical protein PRIPAC_39835 [Pristionchus pacificus]